MRSSIFCVKKEFVRQMLTQNILLSEHFDYTSIHAREISICVSLILSLSRPYSLKSSLSMSFILSQSLLLFRSYSLAHSLSFFSGFLSLFHFHSHSILLSHSVCLSFSLTFSNIPFPLICCYSVSRSLLFSLSLTLPLSLCDTHRQK